MPACDMPGATVTEFGTDSGMLVLSGKVHLVGLQLCALHLVGREHTDPSEFYQCFQLCVCRCTALNTHACAGHFSCRLIDGKCTGSVGNDGCNSACTSKAVCQRYHADVNDDDPKVRSLLQQACTSSAFAQAAFCMACLEHTLRRPYLLGYKPRCPVCCRRSMIELLACMTS